MEDINPPVELQENDYVNQLTLSFLISKNQLQKLNKLKQKQHEEPIYDKERVNELFTQLLNNERPDDLLEDVKTCFDAFIEKSIYYLEIHDKNSVKEEEQVQEKEQEEEEEEPIACAKKHNKSKGVDDIQKLPLNWFNSTRQNYKINQILPRKKEISIK